MAEWLMLATGVLAATVVIVMFWILLQYVDMTCTVRSGRHTSGCPDNSCFCSDCDPCNMYLADRHEWQWQHFHCDFFGVPLNRCWLALIMKVWWMGASSRLGWITLRHSGSDPGQLLLVVIACGLSVASGISLQPGWLSQSTKLIMNSLKYNIINTCLLASSICIVFRSASLQPQLGCCGRAFDILSRQLLRSFFPAALLGESCILVLARSRESAEEYIEQENKFYFLYLVLGVFFSWVAWRLARGTSPNYNGRVRLKLKGVVWRLLIVKMIWCTCRCLHWLLTCNDLRTLPDKYNLLMILVERLAALEVLQLIQRFMVLYTQLDQLPVF
ncbi:unnamed protein product [Durusdinium trenchii]|uniref:Uncharacterized protein n=2 Tax=Durusdinium trenchii TaxID=1381693 RepID=A0ABP0QP81_9DINO